MSQKRSVYAFIFVALLFDVAAIIMLLDGTIQQLMVTRHPFENAVDALGVIAVNGLAFLMYRHRWYSEATNT